jgi:quinol monooxygenase YgiN
VTKLVYPSFYNPPNQNQPTPCPQIIAGLAKIASYAQLHDPETTAHATHVSTDPTADPLTVYAIEEYASQAACDAHMSWPPVLEFMEAWKADPGRLSGAPEVWHSNHVVDGFRRSALAKGTEDPFVVLATLQYSDGRSVEDALSGWEAVVRSTEREEQGTLLYAVGKDVETRNRLTFVEVYESVLYMEDVHVKSETLLRQMEEEQRLRKPELQVHKLRKVAGYLHK